MEQLFTYSCLLKIYGYNKCAVLHLADSCYSDMIRFSKIDNTLFWGIKAQSISF